MAPQEGKLSIHSNSCLHPQSTCKFYSSLGAYLLTYRAYHCFPTSLQIWQSFNNSHLVLPFPVPPHHAHLFFPIYSPAFLILITMIIKSIQKQDTLGSVLLVPPCVKHLLCVAAVFVLLFIFTWQFWRENIPQLLQTKLYLESSNRLHILNFSENKS